MATIRRIRTVMTGVAGTPWYLNWHFTMVTGTAQDAVDNVAAFWDDIKGQINEDVTITVEGDIALIDDTNGDTVGAESASDSVVAATGTGDVLPPATQTLLFLNTGTFLNHRQVRGRVFVPGLIEAANAPDGTPAPAFLAAQVSAAEDLMAASSTSGPWRVLSKANGQSLVVESVTGSPKFAILTSRRD